MHSACTAHAQRMHSACTAHVQQRRYGAVDACSDAARCGLRSGVLHGDAVGAQLEVRDALLRDGGAVIEVAVDNLLRQRERPAQVGADGGQ
eukprot:6144078-Prymnesium_polylepis.1